MKTLIDLANAVKSAPGRFFSCRALHAAGQLTDDEAAALCRALRLSPVRGRSQPRAVRLRAALAEWMMSREHILA